MKLFDSSGKKAGRHSASSKGAAPKAKPEKKKVSQRAAQKRETEDFNRRMAESLGYSRPSISRAVSLLKKDGYLLMDEDGFLTLTEAGRAVAEKIYERHTVLTAALIALGVDEQTAAEDACRIEHVISDNSLAAITKHLKQYGKGTV